MLQIGVKLLKIVFFASQINCSLNILNYLNLGGFDHLRDNKEKNLGLYGLILVWI